MASLDNSDHSRGKSSTASKVDRGSALNGTAATSLVLPVGLVDPTDFLGPIRDDRSAYSRVARSCLQISQYAGNGSSAYIEDSSSIDSSALFHDKSYAETISLSFTALIQCIQDHKDRRSRIIACKTLAIVARGAYAKIRHSPLLFSMRESEIRLEDECGSEVPVALATAALDDPDDGVSASAVEALGILTLSTSNTSATILDDELLREMQAICFARQAPYAPSLRSVADEDPSVPQLELQSRIFQNVLAPRLLQLVIRIVYYTSTAHHRVTLPFLTACLINQLRTSPALSFGLDRTTYAKRWVELDAPGLASNVVSSILLPAMQTALDGDLAHTAAQCALRLANACPNAPWLLEACRWAVVVLKEEISSVGALETKMGSLAALIIAIRAIPLPERFPTLVGIVDEICSLPYTTMAPNGVVSPGLLIQYTKDETYYRRPARVGLLTEIALSFFMDGPLGDTSASGVVNRSEFLRSFLDTPQITAILKETQDKSIIRLRDEIFLVFCTVACEVGRRFRVSPDGSIQVAQSNNPDVEEWAKLCFVVLSSFSPCIRWGKPPNEYMEEDLGTLTAGQASYIRLFQEFLHFVGLVHNSSSVALKLTPNACPPHLLWDQMTESATFLSKFDPIKGCRDSMLKDISNLLDDLISNELKQGVISHHMRLFILALAADQWVQARYSVIRKHFEKSSGNSSTKNLILNKTSAREILQAVSPKRVIAKLLEHHKPPASLSSSTAADMASKKKKDPIKKLALETVKACVACVENIALAAVDWKRRFGPSRDVDEIMNVSLSSLQGRIDNIPMDETMKRDMRQAIGPLCEAGIERIRSFSEGGGSDNGDGDGGGDRQFPVSPLVTESLKYKIKPLVSTSSSKAPKTKKDDYIRGYLMQLTRQIIASRVDMSLFSTPTADSMLAFARARNWLRLSLPPLPESRDARGFKGGDRSLLSWGNSVMSTAGGSDGTSVILAHTMRRCLRYDNEDEFRVMVLMQVCNTTAVEIPEGYRLELGAVYNDLETSLHPSQETAFFTASIGALPGELVARPPLVSATAVYKEPVKSGEFLTWELTLDHFPTIGNISLYPSITYRNMKAEGTKAKKVGADKSSGGSFAGNSKSGESDFEVMAEEKQRGGGGSSEDTAPAAAGGGGSEVDHGTENISIPGEPMPLSSFIGLQPCPLVFFRDSWGDMDTFRFLWFRLRNEISSLQIEPGTNSTSTKTKTTMRSTTADNNNDCVSNRIANASTLLFAGEAIPGGFVTKFWAFMSLTGERLLCVLAETDPGRKVTLHLKSDSKSLLFSMAASHSARTAMVSSLMPGMRPSG